MCESHAIQTSISRYSYACNVKNLVAAPEFPLNFGYCPRNSHRSRYLHALKAKNLATVTRIRKASTQIALDSVASFSYYSEILTEFRLLSPEL